jgi:hypothetical protein
VEDEQDEIGRVSTRAHSFNLESFTDPDTTLGVPGPDITTCTSRVIWSSR